LGNLILITGGVRSGKSGYAQELASKLDNKVLFVATAEALDDEMRLRITEHRKTRPPEWQTLEVTNDIGYQIRNNVSTVNVVIIDCITLLLNNIFSKQSQNDLMPTLIETVTNSEISKLINQIQELSATFIIVTNEVGSGIVPDNEIARLYRDLLGKTNQMLAEQAKEVYLMISGIPLKIKPAQL
jgi:adenosylcobinamide kinase / adenosylcobinamide-phosphate guanylyltransferase